MCCLLFMVGLYFLFYILVVLGLEGVPECLFVFLFLKLVILWGFSLVILGENTLLN